MSILAVIVYVNGETKGKDTENVLLLFIEPVLWPYTN